MEQVEPAHLRHHQIADDDGGAEGGDFAHRLLPVSRFVRLEAPGLNELGEPAAGRGIVFDDEHPFGDHRLGFQGVCHLGVVRSFHHAGVVLTRSSLPLHESVTHLSFGRW
jgi:hypothetical protein